MNENEVLAKGLSKEKKSFSLVWIAPIIALFITSGMIYKTNVDAGTRITIVVDSGDGIKDGKTPIMYKGIKIGMVEDIHIKNDDVSKLELTALIDKQAAPHVTREGNKFWMVKPKVSITEVSGLDTIISGIYISVMPAANTKAELLSLPYKDEFIALDSAPIDIFNPGLAIRVNTVKKGDIAIGAPVLYNKQAIGKVEDKKLSADRLSIDLFLRIDSKYMDLIHEESIFYKTDAVEVKASLGNVEVNMGSFASFIAGGIALHNTDACQKSPLAKNNASFDLVDNYDEILFSQNEIVLQMQDHNTLTPNITKVYYKGVQAGLVKHIDYDPKTNQTQVRVKLRKDFREFANKKAYFWIVKPKLNFDGIEGLDTVVRGNYINFISTDQSAKQKSEFILHDAKPSKSGVLVRLQADNIQGLKEGAGLFYHSVKIGEIASYRLNKDKNSFTINIIVEPKYTNLLNASSRFYYHGGISLEASLNKVLVRTGSVETLLRGGISVDTFDFKKAKALKKEYLLFDNKDAMLQAMRLSKKGVYLTLISENANSLKKGSAVFYKKMKAGEILDVRWDTKIQMFYFEIFIYDDYAKEVRLNSLFYNASGLHAKVGLKGLKIDTGSIESVISGGISFYNPSASKSALVKNHANFNLYKNKEAAMNTYINISLTSCDADELEVGSQLTYKNITIGQVESIQLHNEDVLIHAQVNAKYKKLLNKETIFWLERFELGLGGLKNPAAALKGASITIMPGKSSKLTQDFILMKKAPPPHFKEDGLRIMVDATRLGSIKPHTPVYFRQIKIGSVVQYELKDDATGVNIELFIEPCFAHLVRKNSYFFNTSGIGMEVSLFGAKVQTETIESIIGGGIGILTPDDIVEPAQNADVFILNETFDEDALEWSPMLFPTDTKCMQINT